MRENNNDKDQHEERINADYRQIYDSQEQGRHNLEETSLPISNEKTGENVKPSIIQINDSDQEYVDIDQKPFYKNDISMEDDTNQYGQNTSSGKLNDIEKAKTVSSVEGDDQDILGETENRQRNEQQINAVETNKEKHETR